jgi:UDP-galactopyranose mutase
MKYDYLIVGAGLFGSAFAREKTDRGKRCLIIDRRPHIGGNVYTEEIEGIQVHRYGPHIFHTDDKTVWDYVNRFADFNHFIYAPIANYMGELYNLPFNMNTFYGMWGVRTPAEAREIIDRQRAEYGDSEPRDLEEQAISLVGRDIYDKLIKGYTEKQWGRPCAELPAFIIKRLPVRFTFDNNYFDHRYQGIPIGGYAKMTARMLEGVDLALSADYLRDRAYYDRQAHGIIYTGRIDEYYDYRFGQLEYRSLRFESETLDTDNHQGVAAVNYTDKETPFTRIVEHKHFEFGQGNAGKTVITREYPAAWTEGAEPYYPVNDRKNNALYEKYRRLAQNERRLVFGGRMGLYRYFDMEQVIALALQLAKKEEEGGAR